MWTWGVCYSSLSNPSRMNLGDPEAEYIGALRSWRLMEARLNPRNRFRAHPLSRIQLDESFQITSRNRKLLHSVSTTHTPR